MTYIEAIPLPPKLWPSPQNNRKDTLGMKRKCPKLQRNCTFLKQSSQLYVFFHKLGFFPILNNPTFTSFRIEQVYL